VRATAVICVLALGGCRGLLGIDEPIVGDAGAAPGDSAPDAETCYGVAPFELCGTFAPTTDLVVSGFGGMVVDTALDCDAVVRGWCVIARTSITIAGAGLKATGSRPLALLALGSIDVSGQIRADAEGATPGPGATDLTLGCHVGAPPSPGLNGGGGGAGGSFVTAGGAGGAGNVGANPGGTPGTPVGPISDLRGGCSGGTGAPGNTLALDPGGAGGGGVYLLAATSMNITGTINASGGGGGRGRQSKSGGSGGGSGGMIVLWSPMLTGSPTLIASGGGGGGGADNGANGTPGGEGLTILAALGGAGGSQGAGVGGKGSLGMGPGLAGGDDNTSAGGGGGGGGGGVLRIFGTAQWTSLAASPPAS